MNDIGIGISGGHWLYISWECPENDKNNVQGKPPDQPCLRYTGRGPGFWGGGKGKKAGYEGGNDLI